MLKTKTDLKIIFTKHTENKYFPETINKHVNMVMDKIKINTVSNYFPLLSETLDKLSNVKLCL